MDFRHISRRCVRVVLIEGGDRLLAALPPALGDAALASLRELGVDVRLGARVTSTTPAGSSSTASGSRPRRPSGRGGPGLPAARWLGVEADRSGRVPVDATLAVPGLRGVHVIGDTAAVTDAAGRQVLGVAAAAKQQGRHVARVIAARLGGTTMPEPFRYRDHGSLATHRPAPRGRRPGKTTADRPRRLAALGAPRTSSSWSAFRNRLVVGASYCGAT